MIALVIQIYFSNIYFSSPQSMSFDRSKDADMMMRLGKRNADDFYRLLGKIHTCFAKSIEILGMILSSFDDKFES